MTLARDLPCVVLSVDPGATSGWALLTPGFHFDDPREGCEGNVIAVDPVMRTGTAATWRERGMAILEAKFLAAGRKWPLVVVAETWLRSGGKRGIGLAAIGGLGAQWGLWLAELERHEDVPSKRVIRVDTGTWGQAILGRSHMTTEQRRSASMMRARAVLGRDVTHDEAAALCIGLWALRAEKVAKAIGKRELKRLGWSEVLG